MAKKIIIGNASVTGFVNYVDGNRFVLGTGSYTPQGGEKVFKESITVFADDKFDGAIPAKGDYVQVNGDISIQPRRDQPEQLNSTMNVRFANQVVKKEAPKKANADAPAAAGAGGDGADI